MPFGYHIKKQSRTLAEAVKEDVKKGEDFGLKIDAMQIFVSGPYNSKEILNDEDKKFLKAQSARMHILVHASYLDHLFGKRPQFTVINIRKELQICKEIGAAGLVVHMPSKYETVDEIVKIIDKICGDNTQCPIYLELMYNKNNKYALNSDNILNKLFDEFKTKKYTIGLCIDTAHIWAAGVDIMDKDSAELWLNNLPKNIPYSIHLNDQYWPFNSGSDEHAMLTTGTIWKKYGKKSTNNIANSGLAAFLYWAEENNAICVLEYPSNRSDLQLIWQLGAYRS